MAKLLVINADDFGFTQGVNRGIIEAFLYGVVTSTSMMVDSPWSRDAAVLARQYPNLGVGLHFVASKCGGDTAAMASELRRQYQLCTDLLGREVTHLDSHHHMHLKDNRLNALFKAWAEEHGLPVRGLGSVIFNGGFYGQIYDTEWRPHSAPELIGFGNLEKILRALTDGYTELACHPGYLTPDLDSYSAEREIELQTLLDPRVPIVLRDCSIRLVNYLEAPGSRAVKGEKTEKSQSCRT
jgi:predicted glycoside hydrolase/deacetylase ChbG (UPF0249 family)